MTEAKHTPGPWVAGRICEESHWVDIYKIEDDGMPSLAFAACKHFDQEANARLISAAPDLLAALKAMVALDEDEHQRGPGDIDICKEVQDAYAAISKAEGGA